VGRQDIVAARSRRTSSKTVVPFPNNNLIAVKYGNTGNIIQKFATFYV